MYCMVEAVAAPSACMRRANARVFFLRLAIGNMRRSPQACGP